MKRLSALDFTYEVLRNLLGVRGVCIYHPVSCGTYARHAIKNKPLYLALPLITLRVLSCNPITAFIKKIISTKTCTKS